MTEKKETVTDTQTNKTNDKLASGARVIKGSFWIIATIHITVFTAIGAATGRWRLLVVFIIGFVLTMAVYAGIKIWLARRKKGQASPPNSIR